MSSEYTFTIVTCTYNRAHTLHRPYESLCAQSFRDFEWIVFDNGSTDNTRTLIHKWKQEASFPIRYLHWSKNTGYQNTFNEGIKVARGRFFLILDSDDRCLPNALERFVALWEGIPRSRRDRFAGVTVLCKDQYGRLSGEPFPKDHLVSDALELQYRYKVSGEKWGFVRMELLRRYPFPTTPHHVMPHVVWHRIAVHYKTLYVNETLRIYYDDRAGVANQLTASAPRANAKGKAVGQLAIINNDLAWFPYAPWTFFKASLQYIRFSLHAGERIKSSFRQVSGTRAKMLYLFSLPGGISLFVADLCKEKLTLLHSQKQALDFRSKRP